jgi:hypothetical protein
MINRTMLFLVLVAGAYAAGLAVAQTTMQTGREPQFENSDVKVWKSLVLPHVWQTGKAYWLPANAPGTRHQDVNVGDKPIEVMVVELQKAG